MTPAVPRVSRRTLLVRTALIGTALATLPRRSWSAVATDPVVEIASGRIKGYTVDGVGGFKGVPYGASTAGAHRFMAPQKPVPWAGVRDAIDWAGHSPQAFFGQRRPEVTKLAPPPDPVPVSEDCLTLNVWTPGLDNGTRPVMVWYHGGAFSYGSANTPRTEGARLARRGDVVMVTVNHRLNIFGFLDLAALDNERFVHSGNAGVLDLVASLEWVRDNIAGFGGDPGNVTIFGQSGGGGKVSALLAMPAAKGLFHHAIVMSGAGIRMADHERSTKLAEAVLGVLGLTAKELDKLQSVPIKDMIAAIQPAQEKLAPAPHRLLDRYGFGPVVDGRDLPSHPFDPKATDLSDNVPVMVGGTKDENAVFLAPDDAVWNRSLSEAELKTRVAKVAGDETDAVIDLYRRMHPTMNASELLIEITTDSNFWVRSVLLAQRKSQKGKAPVFMYSFNWQTPVLDGKLMSPHAIDVPFVFETTDVGGITGNSPEARELAVVEATIWAAFARAGTPDSAAIPHWPSYNTDTRATMMIDTRWTVVEDPQREARLIWEKIALG
jgi:para-nitrobenzyl esterase